MMGNSMKVEIGNAMFNHRVLELGKIEIDQRCDIEDLKYQLQFNEIFRSNSGELFERYDCGSILASYMTDLNLSNDNIRNLTQLIPQLRDWNSFEARLTTFRRLSSGLTSCHLNLSERDIISWDSNKLYYLTPSSDGSMIVTSADMDGHIYASPFSYRSDDEIIAWRTEDCILEYLKSIYGPTIAIKPVVSRDYAKLTKVEFHGDISIIPACLNWLSSGVVLVENDYLYTGDLVQLIDIIIDDDEDDGDGDDFDLDFVVEADESDEEPDEDSELSEDVDTDETDQDDESDIDDDDDDDDDDQSEEAFTLDNIFDHDWLMEYPYARFDAYLRFLRLVSIDPRVDSLSICLYRIGDNPILFYLLRESSRRGIHVTVNVEADAGGEAINAFWLKELANVGVTVVDHGGRVHKVHAKLTLVSFNDGRKIAQIGTGNYHWKTTTRYNDLSLYTAEPSTCEAISATFKLIGLEAVDCTMFENELMITGVNATQKFIQLIRHQASLGQAGLIVIKANSFDGNTPIADELELASLEGCRVELIIRGCCSWIPHRLNDNVHVKSVVWDQLEHARVYQFGAGDDVEIYMGSLDPIARKLNHRVETMVRIASDDTVDKLRDYLDQYMADKIGHVWYMVVDQNFNVGYRRHN